MAYDRTRAAKLLSAAEMELFDASRGARAGEARAAGRIPIRSSRELLERKRAAQSRLEAARRVERSPKAPSRGPRTPRRSKDETSEDVGAVASLRQFQEAGVPAVQGHVSSAVRRSQAKRDR